MSANSPIGGQSGVLKTLKRVSASLYWEGMKHTVQNYVAKCIVCQQNKYSTLAILLQVWEDLSMNFIEGLPKFEDWDTILVVVDRFSKHNHFIGLKHPFTTPSVAAMFSREFVLLHGIPCSIVSDRDKVFLSKFWTKLFRLQGTTLKFSTTYHPQTDGQIEVVNRHVETYFRCFVHHKPKSWGRFLSWAEYWYNTFLQSATQTTPCCIVYVRDPPTLLSYEPGSRVFS